MIAYATHDSTPSQRHIVVRAIGFGKYLYNQGKEWTDILRGSLTPILLAGYMADAKGHSPTLVILIPLGIILSGILFGLIAWRWRVVHETIEKEWENNPYLRMHIDTLRMIEQHLAAIRESKQ